MTTNCDDDRDDCEEKWHDERDGDRDDDCDDDRWEVAEVSIHIQSDPPTLRECLQLLGRANVGRVGFVADDQPRVFPVNYAAADDGRVVFRTGEHGLLSAIDGTRVAFEIDGYDSDQRKGWCVQVLGVAREITAAQPGAGTSGTADAQMRTLRVEPWDTGDKDRWFVIDPLEVSGRRIEAGAWPRTMQGWFAGVPMS